MCKIPGITASVVNKIELEGKEVLCGYYVSNQEIEDKEVKELL